MKAVLLHTVYSTTAIPMPSQARTIYHITLVGEAKGGETGHNYGICVFIPSSVKGAAVYGTPEGATLNIYSGCIIPGLTLY